MIKKIIFIVLSYFLIASSAWAQVPISGKVIDVNGNPLIGANITVKGQKTKSATNQEGRFKINLPKLNTTISISHSGFKSKEIEITSADELTISLEENKDELTEVVVTGYSNLKRSQFSGATDVIKGKAFEDIPNGSFTTTLQGRAAGVLVNSGSGQPGSAPRVQIRGISSISGAFAQPLYIVDGVPYNSNDFQSLNANDFESVTILKDAEAVALYGSRGANGVLVITTQRGKAGKIKVTLRTQYGITEKPDFSRLNLMSSTEFLQYQKDVKAAGLPGYIYSDSFPGYAALPQATKDLYASYLDTLRNNNVDFTNLFYRTGINTNNEVHFSGGSEKTRFFSSLGFFNQDGIDKTSYLKRLSARFNLDHVDNKLTINLSNLIAFSEQGLSNGEFLGNSALNAFQLTFRALPYQNPYRPDGSLAFGPSTNYKPTQVANAIEARDNTTITYRQLKINSSFSATYNFTDYLSLKNTSGVDLSDNVYQRFVNPDSYRGSLEAFNSGSDQESFLQNVQLINTSALQFNKTFNSVHAVTANIYYEAIYQYNKSLGFILYNLDKRLTLTGNGAASLPTTGLTVYPQRANGLKSSYGIQSYFGFFKYSYNDRYSATFSIRQDGTSRIRKPENRQLTSWAVGFVWNTISENFLSSSNVISDLKIRINYGITPNITAIPIGFLGDPGGSGVPIYLGGQVPSYAAATYLGSTIAAQVPSSPGYEDLKIEKVNQVNIGFDLGLFKNRINLVLDYYEKSTKDLYVLQTLSATAGFGSLDINAGTLSNKGIDFKVDFAVVRTRDFKFNVIWNHNFNMSNIEDLGSSNPDYQYVAGTYLIKKGLPFGSLYTYDYRGVRPSDGLPLYRAATAEIVNPDGTRTYNKSGDTLVTDIAKAGQFATFGSWIPVNTGGVELRFSYKQFAISALFSYQYDVNRYNNIRNWTTRGTLGYIGAVRPSRLLLTDQWRQPGDVKYFPKFNNDKGFTSADIEDASFVRFRNLDISYTFLSKSKHWSSIRVYLQAQNLYFWSNFTGLDPEDNNNISLQEYPNPKFFNIGLDINF